MNGPRQESAEARLPLEQLIEALSRPGALAAGERAEVIQTHISVVFLAGDRAWKIKKPIRLWGLVDYGTVERRRHWCEEEVRLNRRLAPDIYLGVVPVTLTEDGLEIDGEGAVIEHAVEMVRIPAGVTLLEQLQAGALDEAAVADVGIRLAAFAEAHRLESPAARGGLPSEFALVMRRNFAGSQGGVPEPFPEAVHEGLRVRIVRRLAGERNRIRARVARGLMVDGHGDIRLEHVLRRGSRIEIIDCCEFSQRLRHIDPLSDAAFLSMDLALKGRPDLGEAFERAFVTATADRDAAHLLPLYRAYRAHVRAMVSEQTCRKPELPADLREEKDRTARRCLALAWSEARVGAVPPVIVMRGAAGTGKSWLSTRIAPLLRGEVIRSDVVRKELLGMDPTERPAPSDKAVVYGGPMHARTYATMLDRARAATAAGSAALLDATYVRRSSRAEVHALAEALGAPFAILDLTCDPLVVRRRLRERAARNDDASDADWVIYQAQMAEMDPIEEAEAPFVAPYDAEQPAETALMPLLDVLEAQLDARRERLGPDPEHGSDV